jgi:hypothetical protein
MLVERDQVLDFGRSRGEAGCTTKNHVKEIEMIDNAAIATTIIGLDAVRHEQERYDALVPQPRRIRSSRGVAARLTVAQALRRLADSLEASRPTPDPRGA